MPDAAPKGSPLLPTRACPRAHRAGSVEAQRAAGGLAGFGGPSPAWLPIEPNKRQTPHKDAGGVAGRKSRLKRAKPGTSLERGRAC